MDISQTDSHFNDMQNIKRKMFALRNGIIADRLRKAGDPHRVVFGLNLPQLDEIARSVGFDRALALALWDNSTTRESRLLAPMIMNPSEFTEDDARQWLSTILNVEEADILCHKLLRHLDNAADYVFKLTDKDNPAMARYTGLRLAFNLIYKQDDDFKKRVLDICEAELKADEPLTARVARQLQDEIQFLLTGELSDL